MSSSPVRRAHLISPFGVGALLVAPDGTSMICAGLDHWFDDVSSLGAEGDVGEFQFSEWRLQERLGVSHFRLPPDHRAVRGGRRTTNVGLSVPFLRFPTWHVCPSPTCRSLFDLGSFVEGTRHCDRCHAETGRKVVLTQVPFVAMCDSGHLVDFPWREWVHRAPSTTCTDRLTLRARGGTTLADQVVACECGATRTLAGITEASPDGDRTRLSDELSAQPDEVYLCPGSAPQHGPAFRVGCTRPLRASLRAASNLYFGNVVTSIFLPERVHAARPELVELLRHPAKLNLLALYRDAGYADLGQALRQNISELAAYSPAEITEAADVVLAGTAPPAEDPGVPDVDDHLDLRFRMDEARLIRASVDHDRLLVRAMSTAEFSQPVAPNFSRVSLLDRLCETRALAGFSRVFPEQGLGWQDRDSQLWSRRPDAREAWLPAYQVFGEGIYLEFDEERLAAWEARTPVANRAAVLQRYADAAAERRQRAPVALPPRYILAHTVAHLLMNELTFECGYSTAALRERLYVSNDPADPRAGILIYTAAGDAEGTMGGLVRMGQPGRLEAALTHAVQNAQWCATDPVCMEFGAQGPESCNLAACHSCCLVPETACEQFNRYLDRALVIGTPDDSALGFFST